MKTFEEIERIAAKAPFIAVGWDGGLEQMCYLALHGIYALYRLNEISREQGQRQKAVVRRCFDKSSALHDRYRLACNQYQENIRNAGRYRAEINKGIRDGKDVQELFSAACACIGAMTGDANFPGGKRK